MAKAPASTSLSPRTSNTPTDVFQEIDFTKPFENFSRKVSEPSATQQRLPLVSRTIIDLLPELLQIRNSIPRWRASIEGMPGIDSNAAEQAQRSWNSGGFELPGESTEIVGAPLELYFIVKQLLGHFGRFSFTPPLTPSFPALSSHIQNATYRLASPQRLGRSANLSSVYFHVPPRKNSPITRFFLTTR
ncbi:hypothetical protein BV898_07155 [Hypsibius exemplaris]|uniref:Uncharacterized protein n=1 Tax=Hypsibius exemplaris TaxID=2072580 RepID=A0A1W0WU42_HYPEX|nr:hypothetical protein BV898_07155 [Hypsibius exemplaris]